MKGAALQVLVAGWIGWLSIYYSRLIISPTLPYIEHDLTISHAEAGLLMTAYFIPYALSQVPGGKLSYRYGPRYVLAVSMAIIAASTLLLGFVRSLPEALLLRAVTGVGAGFYFAPLNAIIFHEFAGKERGRALGITSSGAGLGIILTAAVTGLFAPTIGWRALLILSAAVALTVPLFLRLGESSRPSQDASRDRDEGIEWSSMRGPYAIGFIHHLAYNVFLTYVPVFLVESRQFSVAGASLAFSAIPLLMLFGQPTSGYLADFLGRKLVVIASLVGCALSILLLLQSWQGLYIGASLLVMGAAFNTLYTPLNAYALDLSRPSSVGVNLAALNGIAYIGSAIGPYLAGFIADRYGFEASFAFIAALMALALMPALRMRSK